jgi:hypothetical protein
MTGDGCVQNSGAVFEGIGSQSKQWGKDAFEPVGSGSKRRARVRNSAVGFKTAGLRSKQCGWVQNGGLEFKAVGLSLKRRVHV